MNMASTLKRKVWIAIPLMALFWINSAQSASVTVIGKTVMDVGSTALVGLPAGLGGKITYYIPLNSSDTGTYGVTDTSTCGSGPLGGGGTAGAGTCSDSGSGAGYIGADALTMNIYFDLTGLASIVSATLDFVFDDLDLIGTNDPYKFYESMSLSYLNTNTSSLVNLNEVLDPPANNPAVIQSPGDMTGMVTVSATKDPIYWSLDLAAILGDLNASESNNNKGFWIQLGFGSDYKWTGTNTPEYLTSSLTVSAVPIPAAIWLFGTAILGLVGVSRRRKAA